MTFNKKILVLGNETANTDDMTSSMAKDSNSINHGLISNPTFLIEEMGYYHSSLGDLSAGDIVHISNRFDSIVMLDQPKETYPHFKSFMATVRLMQDLESLGIDVTYQNKSTKNIIYWKNLLKENKSFCFHPFMALINNSGSTAICPKNDLPITKIDQIEDWQTDLHYNEIRNKMLAGELMPERCHDCYSREAEGQESTRQFETLEWAQRMSFNSIEDFTKIKSPLYYEIRPNNLCNILCRTCDSAHSHLIEREWKTIGIPIVENHSFATIPFDMINFEDVKRIYWGGGEPTVMPEFYEFLQKCIDIGKTDFELEIGTNGMKYSNKLVKLLDNFTNVNFAFSFDGYKKINDYIRWGSEFNTIVKNSHMLINNGHKISLQTVFSMYSISRMHEVFEFYDQEYPGIGALVQVGGGQDDINLPYNHPCPELVIDSMKRCQQTKVYYSNGRSVRSMVDLLIDHYTNPDYKINIELLKKFYENNDKLDKSRNSQLGDYIPELQQARGTYGI